MAEAFRAADLSSSSRIPFTEAFPEIDFDRPDREAETSPLRETFPAA